MSELKRYECGVDGSMREHGGGRWLWRQDVEAAISAARAEVERLTAEVEILSAIDDLFMGKIAPVDDEWLYQQRYRLKQLRAQIEKGGA